MDRAGLFQKGLLLRIPGPGVALEGLRTAHWCGLPTGSSWEMRQRARPDQSSGAFEPEGWGKPGKCCMVSSSDDTWVACEGWQRGGWLEQPGEAMAPAVRDVLGQGSRPGPSVGMRQLRGRYLQGLRALQQGNRAAVRPLPPQALWGGTGPFRGVGGAAWTTFLLEQRGAKPWAPWGPESEKSRRLCKGQSDR